MASFGPRFPSVQAPDEHLQDGSLRVAMERGCSPMPNSLRRAPPAALQVPRSLLSIRAWNHSSPPYLSLNILPLVPLGKRFDQPLNVEAPAIDSVSLLLVCLHFNWGHFLLLLLFNVILLLCGMRTLRCFVWGLVPGPGMEPGPPCTESMES